MSQVIHTSAGEVDRAVADFKKTYGIEKVIAIAGGAEDDSVVLEEMVRSLIKGLSGYRVAILTGGTRWGVPKMAAEAANKLNIPVIGVYPQRGEKYVFDGLDLSIEVDPRVSDSEWGDGTEVFIKLADAVVFFGGSFGTQIEHSFLMKTNEGRIDHKLNPIYFVPVVGFGGWSEIVYGLPTPDKLKACFPENGATNAKDILSFIAQNLF